MAFGAARSPARPRITNGDLSRLSAEPCGVSVNCFSQGAAGFQSEKPDDPVFECDLGAGGVQNGRWTGQERRTRAVRPILQNVWNALKGQKSSRLKRRDIWLPRALGFKPAHTRRHKLLCC